MEGGGEGAWDSRGIEGVALTSFRCGKMKTKLAVLVAVLLGKEGVEARGGVPIGFGAGKNSVCCE